MRVILREERDHGWLYQKTEGIFEFILSAYIERMLRWVLRNSAFVLLIAMATLAFNIYLFYIVPKGFFPQQDTGRLNGNFIGDQSISFQAMQGKITAYRKSPSKIRT